MALLEVEGLSISLPTPEGRRPIVDGVDLPSSPGRSSASPARAAAARR